jgi:citrate synthase
VTETARKTAISSVESGRIVLRGYALEELVGNVSWAAASYLTLVGKLPDPPVEKLFEAILVSVADHGPTPPSTVAACTVASTGASLSSALAAGILGIAKFHGGAIEDCMRVLKGSVETRQDPAVAAAQVARDFKMRGARVPGFGHRLHEQDPRTRRLFELANEVGLSSNYVRHAQALEKTLSESAKKRIPINADGAIAALLCEIDFPPDAANGIFMMARVPGLIAHVLEEQARNAPLRSLNPSAYEYDGPRGQKLEPSHAGTDKDKSEKNSHKGSEASKK